jgi:hypothetical protein
MYIPLLASSYVTVEAIKGIAAVWVQCVVIQKPVVSFFGFVEDGFGLD